MSERGRVFTNKPLLYANHLANHPTCFDTTKKGSFASVDMSYGLLTLSTTILRGVLTDDMYLAHEVTSPLILSTNHEWWLTSAAGTPARRKDDKISESEGEQILWRPPLLPHFPKTLPTNDDFAHDSPLMGMKRPDHGNEL